MKLASEGIELTSIRYSCDQMDVSSIPAHLLRFKELYQILIVLRSNLRFYLNTPSFYPKIYRIFLNKSSEYYFSFSNVSCGPYSREASIFFYLNFFVYKSVPEREVSHNSFVSCENTMLELYSLSVDALLS